MASIMKKLCFVNTFSNLTTTRDAYLIVEGGTSNNTNASITTGQTQMPVSGSFTNLYLKVATSPGDGGSWTIALMVNGVATPLAVSLAGANLSAQSTAIVSVSAGDLVCVKTSYTGSPANAIVSNIMMEFEAANPGESFIIGMSSARSVTSWNMIPGSSTEKTVPVYCPSDFTLDQLYSNLDTPAASGFGYTVHVVKNGVDTGLSATFSAGDQYVTNLTDSVHFVKGDQIAFRADVVTGGATSANRTFGVACRMTPDIDGENPYFGSTTTGAVNNGDRYVAPVSNANVYSVETSEQAYILGDYTFKNLSFYTLGAVPGSGTSFTCLGRINGADGTVAAVMSDTNTEGHDYTHSDSLVAGDLLAIKFTPTNHPAVASYSFSHVLQSTSGLTPPPITRRHQARYTYFL